MEKLFNHMLVPFRRWEEDDHVIQSAIELANQLGCNLHLLRFMQGPVPAGSEEDDPVRKDLRQRYQPRLHASLSLTSSNRSGSLEEGIIASQRKLNIDLLFLSRRSPSRRLLRKVNCPVLDVGRDPYIPPIRHIVLTVGPSFPMRKLLYAIYVAKRSGATIHLVAEQASGKEGSPAGIAGIGGGTNGGGGNNGGLGGSEGTGVFQRAYRVLRENTDLRVECRTIEKGNLASAAWSYARQIKADLMLMQPGQESRLPGLLSGLRTRMMSRISRIPVLTVPQ